MCSFLVAFTKLDVSVLCVYVYVLNTQSLQVGDGRMLICNV